MMTGEEKVEAVAQALYEVFIPGRRGTRSANREVLEWFRHQVQESPRLMAAVGIPGAELGRINQEAYYAWRWQGAVPDFDREPKNPWPLDRLMGILCEMVEAWVDQQVAVVPGAFPALQFLRPGHRLRCGLLHVRLDPPGGGARGPLADLRPGDPRTAVILPGCTIGDGAIIAAGAVLPMNTRVGPGEVWAGAPAKAVAATRARA